jgi:hypothetical protein
MDTNDIFNQITLEDTKAKKSDSRTITTKVYNHEKKRWEEIGSSLKPGIYRIGLFADVNEKETIEWVPTLYNVEISEWAVWASTFNSGLITWYDFNEPTGTILTDIVFGRHNGTSINTPTLGASGIINNAYSFAAGSQEYVNLTENYADFNFSGVGNYGNITLSAWVYKTGGATVHAIVDRSAVGSSAWEWNVNIQNKISASLYESGGLQKLVISDDIIDSNKWVHTAISANGSNLNVYINGTLVKSTTYDGTIKSISYPPTIGTQMQDPTITFNGRIDEVGIWNRSLSDAEILSLYNGGLGLSPLSTGVELTYPVDNAAFMTLPVIFNATISTGGTMTNATLFIWSNATNIFNQTFKTISGLDNYTSFTIYTMPPGNYHWNVLGCSDISCQYANSNFTLRFGFIENSQTYSASTTYGSLETFLINITYDSVYYNSIAVNLVYNNTDYTPVQTGTGNNKIFNASITIPQTTGLVSMPFYWRFELTNSSGFVFFINSTNHTQSVNPFQADNCSIYLQEILNFTLLDEDARTILNGTVDIIVDFYNLNRNILVGTFNKSFTILNGQGARVCINQTGGYSMDYQTKYYSNTTNYVQEYKFAQNIFVNSSTPTQNINLYDLLDARSTAFQITLQSSDLSSISGAVIDIQRKYVPINQFISVESPLTDSLGKTIGHFVSETEYYNIVVSKNGVLIATFNNQIVQCQNPTTGDCRILLNLIQSVPALPNFKTYGNISANFNLDKTTRIVTMNFISLDSLIHNVTWYVLKADNWGNTSICSNSVSAASGTFTCVIPTLYGNSSVYADLYSDGIYLGRNWFSLMASTQDIWGGTKVIFGILMYTILVMMFVLASPLMLVIGAMLGMAFVTVFHFVDGGSIFGNTSIVLWFLIAGGIILYHMRNKL